VSTPVEIPKWLKIPGPEVAAPVGLCMPRIAANYGAAASSGGGGEEAGLKLGVGSSSPCVGATALLVRNILETRLGKSTVTRTATAARTEATTMAQRTGFGACGSSAIVRDR